nr:hypothetical protein [Candidatus Sigynarchaeota archaeon]
MSDIIKSHLWLADFYRWQASVSRDQETKELFLGFVEWHEARAREIAKQ